MKKIKYICMYNIDIHDQLMVDWNYSYESCSPKK